MDLRWERGGLVSRFCLAWLLAWNVACTKEDSAARSRPQFVDVADRAGVRLLNVTGTPEKKHIIEVKGGGVAIFDYDDDGDVDLFFINGSRLEGFPPGQEPRATLYRNEGDWRFTDVGAQAGVDHVGWGRGCNAVDYNGDGFVDLFLTCYGPNALYRNNGDGTFTDVAVQAGVADPGLSSGAAFGDYDGDGDLDFLLTGYIDFDPEFVPFDLRYCTWHGIRVCCGPRGMPGLRDRFYRNEGPESGWSFVDASEEVGLASYEYYGFAALTGDYDNDGDLDIYIANDSTPNLLYRNDGGHFRDVALLVGAALTEDGREQGGMGLAVGDYDNDGDLDIFVTNFSNDNNTLYQNDGRGFFSDVSFPAGLGDASLEYVGWGADFFDYDNDGDEDLFVANGHVYPAVDQLDLGTRFAQTNQLFENLGDGHFEEVTRQAGSGLQVEKSSRGAALGDLDNDGDLDIAVLDLDDFPSVLRNDGGNRLNWLMVKLVDQGFNRDAIGARVTLFAAGRRQLREVRTGTGFLSHSDIRLHFGLGEAREAERLVVRWPDGQEEVLEHVAGNRLVTVARSQGIVAAGFGPAGRR